MKLKLTDSPGIAGGFYWINPKKGKNIPAIFFPMRLFAVIHHAVRKQNNEIIALPLLLRLQSFPLSFPNLHQFQNE